MGYWGRILGIRIRGALTAAARCRGHVRFLPKSLVTLLAYEIILLTYYLGTTEILLGDYKHD